MPESLAAEAAVLGSMIIDPACIGEVIEQLDRHAFYRHEHQMIFDALIALYEKKRTGAFYKDAEEGETQLADAVLLRDELEKRKQLEEVGGVEYIAKIMDSVPSSSSVLYYAEIVKDKQLLREMIATAHEILDMAYDAQGETREKLDQAEQKIFDIVSKRITGRPVHVKELITQVYELIERREGRVVTGIATGYHALDDKTCGLQNGEMIVIAGRPSMGKTSLALNMAEYIGTVDKIPLAIFSLEMGKQQLAERFLCSYSQIDAQRVRKGHLYTEDHEKLKGAAGELYEAPIHIDDTTLLTPLELRAKARRLKTQHGIRCVIVDYLQLMSAGMGRFDSRQQEVTVISRYLKALARELNVPVVVLSQLNRSPEGREDHRPRMSDLRESGSIEQDADVVLLLHREDYYRRNERLELSDTEGGTMRSSEDLRSVENVECLFHGRTSGAILGTGMRNSYLVVLVSIMLLSLGPTYAEVEGIGRVLGRYTVKSIQFSFIGKRTYKDKRLLAKLSFKKGDNIDAILADFGREDLEEFYLKRGFAFVEVKLDKESVREGDVIYTIKEGPRVRIKSVKFRGNNTIKTGRLNKAAKTNKKKWFFWRTHYSEEKVSGDVERLLNVYLERGLLDCRITEKQEFTADKSAVHLTFVIEEGPVYIVERIVLKGAERIYSIDIDGLFDEETLRTRLKLEEGKHYRKRQAESDRKKLLELFHEYGFVDARVDLHIDKVFGDEEAGPRVEPVSKAGVNVEFEIFEGQQFRIGRIDVVGNKQTQDKVVRRVLDSFGFQPGQYYNSDVARGDGSGELEAEIRRRVYTEETTITAMTGHEPGQKNVDVQVKEGQTGQWILSAGISSDSGVVGGVILEQRNFDFNDWPEDLREFITGRAFKGAGQSFRISLMPGTELSQYCVDKGKLR
jgi:replicative DNA helicase